MSVRDLTKIQTGQKVIGQKFIYQEPFDLCAEMAYRFSDVSDIGKYRLFLKYRISYRLQIAKLEISDIGCKSTDMPSLLM